MNDSEIDRFYGYDQAVNIPTCDECGKAHDALYPMRQWIDGTWHEITEGGAFAVRNCRWCCYTCCDKLEHHNDE